MNSRAPHSWLLLLPLLLLLLLCRLLGRLTIGCMGRTTAYTCASLNQRSNLLLPTCQQHSLWLDAPEKEPEGAVRGGGLFLEPRERPTQSHVHTTTQVHSSTAPAPLFLCQLPELPLPLQPLMVSLLSGQPLSWGQGL